MKYLQRLLTLLAISFAIFSCQKEYSLEIPGGGTTNAAAQWEFKENGVLFKGPIDTATVDTLGIYKFLTMNGHSTDGKDQISLQVFGTELKAGTYKTPVSLFTYIRNGVVFYQTNQTAAESFTIVITKMDSTGITGTFSGKALDSAKVIKTIADGKFSAAFKTSVPTPATPDSGQVMLWSKAGCGGGTSTSPINVSVSTKTGQITKFFTTEPATCDPAGSYYIKLPVGTYPWTAKCDTNTLTGSVIVTKNGCTKVQVDFTVPVSDYFPTTTNSYWKSLYEGGRPKDSTFTRSNGQTKVVSSNTYNIFDFSDFSYDSVPYPYKDTFYNRKANGIYYQYYTDIAFFDKPTTIEVVFLKDNVAVGSAGAWTSGVIAGTISNQPLVTGVRIDGQILEKAVSATVSSKTFQDVIKVRLSYFLVVVQLAKKSLGKSNGMRKG